MLTSFLIKHDIWKYRLVLQKDKSPLNFKSHEDSFILTSKQIFLSKLRTCNLKIPIEMGRWKNIPRENRSCHLCNEEIGNEFHYLL
jgi:hypothetical protein